MLSLVRRLQGLVHSICNGMRKLIESKSEEKLLLSWLAPFLPRVSCCLIIKKKTVIGPRNVGTLFTGGTFGSPVQLSNLNISRSPAYACIDEDQMEDINPEGWDGEQPGTTSEASIT